jgi:hypothetical protein
MSYLIIDALTRKPVKNPQIIAANDEQALKAWRDLNGRRPNLIAIEVKSYSRQALDALMLCSTLVAMLLAHQ